MSISLQELPVELYVDTRRHPALVDAQTALHFWLYNRGTPAVEAVSMCLQARGAGGLDSQPYEHSGRLETAEIRRFSMACIPRVSGIHVVTLSLLVRFDDDLHRTFELRDELQIKVSEAGDSGSGLTVEIDGSALIDGPLPEGVRRLIIKGDALLDNMADALKSAPSNEDNQVQTSTDQPEVNFLREVKLQHLLDGLSPLDFKKLTRAWGRAGMKSVHTLQFVNDRDAPMGTTCGLCTLDGDADHSRCDHYRLKLKGYLKGYVTVLLCGTSEKYMVAHPTTHTAPVMLAAGRAAYFPDAPGRVNGAEVLMPLPLPEVADMDVLCFTGVGVEQALVLITPQPLVFDAGPLIADTGGGVALQYKRPVDIKSLIQKATAFGHASELGYADIEVITR